MTAYNRTLSESARLRERARALIPNASQTLSKSPSQWVQGVAPAFVRRAEGAYVWDVDGNRYLDLPMALGPVILGHANPRVTQAILDQLEAGILYTLPHPLEADVAERICERVPNAERVRFAKSGSDVNSAAVRLARAVTGRDHVLAAGYHGWHDWFVGTTSRSSGVPEAVRELTATFTFNDLGSLDDALQAQKGDTAAVILEPAGASEPDPEFLDGVAQRAREAGALLIFDEVITGFRVSTGGAQELYGVEADLATFGKALGNGMPISAITGRAEVMEHLGEVFFSGTHGGEALSLAAAAAVLDAMGEREYARLHTLGERLRSGVQGAIEAQGLTEWVSISGVAPRTVVTVREPESSPASRLPAFSLVQQELVKRGILFDGSNFISLALTEEDIDRAADAYDEALAVLANGLPDRLSALLEGPAVAPAFRTL